VFDVETELLPNLEEIAAGETTQIDQRGANGNIGLFCLKFLSHTQQQSPMLRQLKLPKDRSFVVGSGMWIIPILKPKMETVAMELHRRKMAGLRILPPAGIPKRPTQGYPHGTNSGRDMNKMQQELVSVLRNSWRIYTNNPL
jgi:hypothetical protein